MPFIRTQNVVKDEGTGRIRTGSASIIDVEYIRGGGKNHSKQKVREKLGQIVWMAEDKRSGVFLSPTRGLIEYDADDDAFSDVDPCDDRAVEVTGGESPPVHVTLGQVDLLVRFMKKAGLTEVLRAVFPRDEVFQRCFGHILYTVLKNGERISCDDFLGQSFASYLLDKISVSSLRTDSLYFSMMGSDETKVSFFRAYVAFMRSIVPGFGTACYVDSTPLPNDIENNPFRAFSTHGTKGCDQSRLVLVLDDITGLPVWYSIIPGNVIDVSTLFSTVEDVKLTLDIEVSSFVLDSGYTSREVIQAFHIGSEKELISKMPARQGYPMKELYNGCKNMLGNAKYAFIRENHTYFGIRRDIELFGFPIYAYVYLDNENALRAFKTFATEHKSKYDAMTDREKTWERNRGGFFVLLSNKDLEPSELLDEYFSRTRIESVFKTGKQYLALLPLNKWTTVTVNGKILNDIISLIVYTKLRTCYLESGIALTTVLSRCRSLICGVSTEGIINADQPNRNVKEYYRLAGVKLERQFELAPYKDLYIGSKCSVEN